MPRPTRGGGHRPKSDTMLLRRLINNLKVKETHGADINFFTLESLTCVCFQERGSEVAEELERKAHNFLTDVKSKKKPALQVRHCMHKITGPSGTRPYI